MSKRRLSCFLPLLLLASVAWGQSEIEWTEGPTQVSLGDNLATLDVPSGYLFTGTDETQAIMASMGNSVSGGELGLLVPDSEENSWFIVFEYEEVGFVRDDEKDEIDADELFDSISKGTEAANKERAKQGFTGLHLSHWTVEPHYDPSSHNLVWALAAKDDDGGEVINHNERLLGRRGYVSITLVTDPEIYASASGEIESTLAGFQFQDGSRYADFVSGDKIAKYGLTALVAGGAGAAAAKLGLFAVLGKFLAKGWKALVAVFAALGAGIKKLLGRDETPTVEPPTTQA
ncbi:MAG: DUF2167 domain-containing protein [Thermoanaerobaculia bacterium]|nr:DUF2167 domain-containing protein [Thermoanaerobaculia bacterium]